MKRLTRDPEHLLPLKHSTFQILLALGGDDPVDGDRAGGRGGYLGISARVLRDWNSTQEVKRLPRVAGRDIGVCWIASLLQKDFTLGKSDQDCPSQSSIPRAKAEKARGRPSTILTSHPCRMSDNQEKKPASL